MVHGQQGGVAAAGFVAVHAIAHPYHRRHILYVQAPGFFRVGELAVLLLYLLNVLVVFRRGDGEQIQRAVFVRAAILGDADTV